MRTRSLSPYARHTLHAGATLFALLLAWATPALAQQAPPRSMLEQWGFDPAVLVADGEELLRRAPDAQIDGLFQAVHASAQSPDEAQVLCALFAPDADRSLTGLNTIASRLGETSRQRFANAVAEVFVAAAQNPPQRYDVALARQSLKATGVRAALLNDGFTQGLTGNDHAGRCQSIGWLLDALHARPLPERAMVTRLLLSEGLAWVANDQGAAGQTPRLY